MTIPLLPNIGYAEISSAGTLNDAMGSAKTNLPIQFFRLTNNISGNLTIANDASHKKIIIDTNGKTIINSSGSPLTNNSSIDVELKGSGNVQSTLKTFGSNVDSTSNTGTTTITAADNSTMVVAGTNTDTTQTTFLDVTSGNGSSLGFGQTTGVIPVSFSDLPSAFQNVNSSLNGGGNFASGVTYIGDTSQSVGSAPSQVNITLNRSCGSTTSLSGGSNYGLFQNCASGNPFQIILLRAASFDEQEAGSITDRPRRVWFKLPGDRNDRVLTFTNNLAIPVVLTGADPFDSVTVAAGATSAVTRSSSTDGSFSFTGTISGNDGSSQPFALSPVNNGTGGINTDAYTGTFSASGL